MSAISHWLERYNTRRGELPGAGVPWLDALREQAIIRFADEGWPTSRLENWRHTSLALLEERTFAPAAAAAEPAAVLRRLRDADANAGGRGHWLVFVDGRHAPALSGIGPLPAGAEIRALSEVLAAHPERVEGHFGAAGDGASPAALNAALATDGAVIRLARGVALEAPVHLVFIGGVREGASLLRNLVIAEANAEATIVEHYVGAAQDGAEDAAPGEADGRLTNAVTRIAAEQDARITHLKLQEEDRHTVHLAAIDAVQARGSSFASHSLSFGAQLARNDIATRFDGEGCEVLLNGLFHVDGRRHVDHHTRIDHARPRGTSREFYRGVLDGAGRGVFAGRILVAPGAVRTDAMQRADNLLLSPQAEADARPELEIYADDVKCAHGATVGQIDEDSLFYLRTRGLDEAHARNLLTYAFAAEALARIGLAPLRQRAQAAIRARLPGGEPMEDLR
ncbi:Fe-S cluster assembly protein SufD [Thauera sinica]|uniref:Fe-S cluster assembly protein SufD n=1 Tax=Thauera sinica TaxID=2665146 RepID=A0ABW1AXL2_9RHOO|nr:Fe-S cluster assembly protein SufD [Thauera sp. K11]ATE58665.1 Fe-S cluster assembly protein SufD [Thauera sp. K11]